MLLHAAMHTSLPHICSLQVLHVIEVEIVVQLWFAFLIRSQTPHSTVHSAVETA